MPTQEGFFDGCARPLLAAWVELYPTSAFLLTFLERNAAHWAACRAAPAPPPPEPRPSPAADLRDAAPAGPGGGSSRGAGGAGD